MKAILIRQCMVLTGPRLHCSTAVLITCYQRSPFDPSDQEHQVAIDFGAVDKLVNVAGIHRLSCLQAGCANAITRLNTEQDPQVIGCL